MEEQETTEEQAENVEEVEELGDIPADNDNDTEGEEQEEPVDKVELEAWEITGEEENTEKPEKTLKQKKAWKREKQAVNEELERAKAEIETLKARGNTQPVELKRPNPLDFETDTEYEDAKEKYLLAIIKQEAAADNTAKRNQVYIDRRTAGVAEHNTRVGDFVEEKKINPDVYGSAENVFISAFEDAYPGKGEAFADDMLSKLGKGSEKVPYFLGRNKAKLAEFKEVLRSDPTGIQAAMFLADQNRKLRGVTAGKQKSKAPKPAATATGDSSVNAGSKSGKALRKKYNDLHAKGEGAKAWDIKKEARAAGIDTSEWAKS